MISFNPHEQSRRLDETKRRENEPVDKSEVELRYRTDPSNMATPGSILLSAKRETDRQKVRQRSTREEEEGRSNSLSLSSPGRLARPDFESWESTSARDRSRYQRARSCIELTLLRSSEREDGEGVREHGSARRPGSPFIPSSQLPRETPVSIIYGKQVKRE